MRSSAYSSALPAFTVRVLVVLALVASTFTLAPPRPAEAASSFDSTLWCFSGWVDVEAPIVNWGDGYRDLSTVQIERRSLNRNLQPVTAWVADPIRRNDTLYNEDVFTTTPSGYVSIGGLSQSEKVSRWWNAATHQRQTRWLHSYPAYTEVRAKVYVYDGREGRWYWQYARTMGWQASNNSCVVGF
jgi:hypothetical protein